MVDVEPSAAVQGRHSCVIADVDVTPFTRSSRLVHLLVVYLSHMEINWKIRVAVVEVKGRPTTRDFPHFPTTTVWTPRSFFRLPDLSLCLLSFGHSINNDSESFSNDK
ncbi:unnamed protein product [Nezara viridula]|uniref:Uncharacterized protein n=1 Tax=Nezara viridula TaxID=85310 RepID=A0A9P0HQN2_NEZVI|nr:unnamed protein product [Nezara viridula]